METKKRPREEETCVPMPAIKTENGKIGIQGLDENEKAEAAKEAPKITIAAKKKIRAINRGNKVIKEKFDKIAENHIQEESTKHDNDYSSIKYILKEFEQYTNATLTSQKLSQITLKQNDATIKGVVNCCNDILRSNKTIEKIKQKPQLIEGLLNDFVGIMTTLGVHMIQLNDEIKSTNADLQRMKAWTLFMEEKISNVEYSLMTEIVKPTNYAFMKTAVQHALYANAVPVNPFIGPRSGEVIDSVL